MIRRSGELRQRRADVQSEPIPALSRARRIGADRVFELTRHLTERDREVALCVYNQQVLTTDQLSLLFFSSTRRAQDRLLFLYRQRVLDRFFPPSRFGAGKSRRRTGCSTRLVPTWWPPASSSTAATSTGSAATTGPRTRSSPTAWRSTASSLI